MTTTSLIRTILSLCAFIAMILTGAVGAKPNSRDLLINSLIRDDIRVASIGFRLAVANAGRCSKKMPATGLILHSLSQYQGKWRSAATGYFAEPDQVTVEAVVADSPAALAGIKERDAIIALNGERLEQTTSSRSHPTGNRDRAEAFLLALPVGEKIVLTIRREGLLSQLAVMPVAACSTRFELVAGSADFARSDGQVIQVGQGLAGSVSDTDLAVIIAHELAHSILDHRTRLAELDRSKDRDSRRRRRELARAFENQADRLSVHLLASAGFDPRSAPDFMRRVGKGFDSASAADGLHDTANARAAAMDDEILKMGGSSAG